MTAIRVERECAVLAEALSLDDYDRTRVPRPEVEYAAALAIVYLHDEDGERYRVERVFDEGAQDTSSVASVRFGAPDLLGPRPLLWPDRPQERKEAVAYGRSAEEVRWSNADVEFGVSEAGVTWRDGGGRLHVSLHRMADRGYFIWIPEQHGFPCQYHRGEMFRAEGILEGRTVTGWGYLDYAFGARGRRFVDLPMVLHLNKLWATWFASFEDGGEVAGALRWGRARWDWSMAYVVADGVPEVYDPVAVTIAYQPNRTVRGAAVTVGDEHLAFSQEWRLRRQLTTLGTLADHSRGVPLSSTAELEWMPDNAPDLFAAVESGRLTRELMASMRIEGERIVVPGVLA